MASISLSVISPKIKNRFFTSLHGKMVEFILEPFLINCCFCSVLDSSFLGITSSLVDIFRGFLESFDFTALDLKSIFTLASSPSSTSSLANRFLTSSHGMMVEFLLEPFLFVFCFFAVLYSSFVGIDSCLALVFFTSSSWSSSSSSLANLLETLVACTYCICSFFPVLDGTFHSVEPLS